MKKTQVKDASRNIKKNLLSWISVVFIAAMAASSYLGICYSAASMRNAGDNFYQKTSFRDFEITSSLLLTNADIDAIKADEDVKDVEGIYFANAKVSSGDIHEKINIVSVSERINVPEIAEGSLPQKADECAVEQTIAEKSLCTPTISQSPTSLPATAIFWLRPTLLTMNSLTAAS